MNEYEVFSPLPGIFYRQPAPDMPCFVEVGDKVLEHTVIGLIEVMKQFTEVYADQSGQLKEFQVCNGEAIEPGQMIAIIKIDS
ncbi:acetyl-CoA carboxylase [Acerihabitans sp. TG2]|uniref:acetyl-CoA carboxylase n=1 Tax=Acerihabitans sp. TG2 TaxID=3096008 RepID=UPI002B2348F8|nr:acetyl-CoA carboxylase [Acerihabitans sp. TG2]MEA9391188.1 acetyl-CoA carboxylase [Acerihabitans sp. TG2]